jgi:hypothetical protein
MQLIIFPLYLLGGLIPGLADGEFGRLMQALKPMAGMATAFSVNIVLPLVAAGLAVAVPRLRTVWAGVITMTAGYIIGLAIVHPPVGPVKVLELPRLVPPVLVLACFGYCIVGTMTAMVIRVRRRRTL